MESDNTGKLVRAITIIGTAAALFILLRNCTPPVQARTERLRVLQALDDCPLTRDSKRSVTSAISRTAVSNAASLAFEGLWYPLTFRTN
jgi:hypothetical protein